MTATTKTAAPKQTKKVEPVSLASIASSLGWSPKTVRQYARRHRDVFPKPVAGKGWNYLPAQVAAVKKAITDGVTA